MSCPGTLGARRMVPRARGIAGGGPPASSALRRRRARPAAVRPAGWSGWWAVRVNESPQLPQVSIGRGRTSEHLGQATTRASPDGERVMPGS